MKTIVKKSLALLLCAALLLAITACGKAKITVDQEGLVIWSPMKNAVSYRCELVDGNYT